MKVLRSTLLAAAALVAAACGDKVNVVQQTPTRNVLSVVVSPGTLTLVVTQTAQLTAAVSADSGAVTTPVVWSTTDGTKVSVEIWGRHSPDWRIAQRYWGERRAAAWTGLHSRVIVREWTCDRSQK